MKCNTCHLDKGQEYFSWKNKSKGIRSGKCKACQKIYAAEHYKNNSSDYKARSTRDRPAQHEAGRQYILDYLNSHPCVDCGNSDIRVLQFDHREAVGNTTKRVGHYTRSRKKLVAEIAKCDVRCANCHMIRTAEQFGWSRSGSSPTVATK